MTFWTDKKILITGGAGFFGSRVVDELLQKCVQKENIAIPRSREIDLRVWKNCVDVVKDSDIIIHLAARVGGIGYKPGVPGPALLRQCNHGHPDDRGRPAGERGEVRDCRDHLCVPQVHPGPV